MFVAKAIKLEATKSAIMAEEISAELRGLIARFVQTYSNVPDLELDEGLNPKRWFMPLNSYQSKKEAAHYFLHAAALSDYKLTGNPRNVRMLLHFLYTALGHRLYTSKEKSDFIFEIMKYEDTTRKLEQLGELRDEIPAVICSVNQFVEKEAHGDLIAYTARENRKGKSPKDLVGKLSTSVKRMDKQHTSKSWLYLRWMVRQSPDFALFDYSRKDLMVALTTPKLRVSAALGLVHNEELAFELNNKKRPETWWKNTIEYDSDVEKITNFAATLFPEDPSKVDFPFFLLGTWLEYADLTSVFLEKSLRFLTQKHLEMGQPILRYLTVVSHYNQVGEAIEPGAFTGLERNIYDFLKNKQVVFNYEFMEFNLPKSGATLRPLTYKPDFLLPQYTNNGRKVLLEPHGVKDNLKEVLFKLSTFRQHYGDFFCVVLIVPDHFCEQINNLDPQHNAYDFLWKKTNFKSEFEGFKRS